MGLRDTVGTILIVCPGGVEHGGGIGRQMGYFLAAQAEAERTSGGSAVAGGAGDHHDVAYRLVDTRGPWFLGASPQHIGLAVLRLTGAMLAILRQRLAPGACCLHINVAGRGSTVRKLVVTAAARLLATRYLLHVHDYDYAAEFRRRGALLQSLIRGMFRAADTVLVLGAHERTALAGLMDLDLHRVQVVHNAVPDPQAGSGASRTTQPPDRACQLLFLGRLSDRKGVPELLRALADPHLAARRWHATLAGDGPVAEYAAMAASLGLAGRVAFPGWVDQATVRRLCIESDVLVLPSHAEGLAMAVLEGLSHGLAVVATPVGAHAEVIEPDVSGLFVPPGDVPALASAVGRLIDEPDLRQRLGQGARRRFCDRFDVAQYARTLNRLHAQMLAPPRAADFAATEQA